MRNSGSFSFNFQPRFENSTKNQTPLYIRINANGKRNRFSLKRTFTTRLWDQSRERLKGTSKEAIVLNAFLDDVTMGLHDAYRELIRERKQITANSIMARYRGEDQLSKTLLQLSEYHKFTMKSVLKPGTLKNYYTTETYLQKFLKIERKTDDIYLDDLNYAFIIDFDNFLRRNVAQLQSRPLHNNGVMKHLERLKKLLNLAVKLEWVQRDPFAKFSLKFEKIERPFLSQFEIDTIVNANFERSNLNMIRDIFIFSCYTGLSYIDVKTLTKDHIVKGIDGNNWIFTKREKTSQTVKIPLLDRAADIIEKYRDFPMKDNRLLPVYSNQKVNQYLKEMAAELKIQKKFTFHCARHTFATTITLSNGVPLETVSKLLGHSKLSTTQIYAKVLENKISDDIGNLRNVLKDQQQEKNLKRINNS